MDTFTKIFNELSASTGLTQQEIGKIIGANRKTVNKIANNRQKVDSLRLERLIKYCNCSIVIITGLPKRRK
jgi:DNA-binding XRE family transcriptional regulator